jgi:hypothetical protein
MFVTTLLSCRVLEQIAMARLQAIACFVLGDPKSHVEDGREIGRMFAVTIPWRQRSNASQAFPDGECCS